MKKYLLLVMMSLSAVAYTQVNRIVTMMSPTDRHNLFLSTKEVADAYNSLGRTQKANSFYRSAVSIYPIGDEAHQLANQFGISLNDEETYTNFVLFGDTNFGNQQYRVALYSYLMADELDNSPVLYQKIATTYEALGYSENAAFYQKLGKNASTEPTTEEAPTDYTDIDEPIYDEDPIVYEEGLDIEPTYEEGANIDPVYMYLEDGDDGTPTYAEEYSYEEESDVEEDMDATDEVMTLEADVDTETAVAEPVSETNTVNTDGLNDIMQVDYEEQLN